MTKYFSMISFIVLILFVVGCNKIENTSLNPSKIIVYSSGTSKEIISNDKNFQKIIDLTNNRIDKNQLSIAADIVTNDSVQNLKKGELSMEFIFQDNQTLEFGSKSIKYDTLYFLLKNGTGNIGKSSLVNTFQYSDSNNYQESSIGALTYSKELVELVQQCVK